MLRRPPGSTRTDTLFPYTTRFRLVGEVVALSGLGIIGSLTAHLVRKSAGKLILIDPAAERRARSAWMGADAVVDPSEVASVVAELSQGRGVDTFIETSGAPPALQRSAERRLGNEWVSTCRSRWWPYP